MLKALYKLARMDKPIGTILLLTPTLWALSFANNGNPPINLLILFMLGTLIMRSAGCVINDLTDRSLDGKVARTKNRVLVTHEVSTSQAYILLLILLFFALLILIQLPHQCIKYAVLALIITIIYPWGKRFIKAPQFVLGVAFSMGIPMAWVASKQNFNKQFLILILMNILWVIAYDTEYAMVDRDDDLKNNIRSTAILFGKYDVTAIIILLIIMHALWLILIPLHLEFIIFWSIGIYIIYKQYLLIKDRQPDLCFKAFKFNGWYGAVSMLYLFFSRIF
jgi:4-hydroxybenzoate polyprenyltransferase